MISKIDRVYRKYDEFIRICQGDLFEDFTYPVWTSIEDGKIRIIELEIPFLFVLTQDCDLESDHRNRATQSEKQDAHLHHILVCPAYPGEKVRKGTHLEDLNLKMEYQNSNKWNEIIKNNNPRYHHIPEYEDYNLTDLAIDFKHYYSIPRDILYSKHEDHYKASLNELFRESLSHRFAYYLSRIGLPEFRCEE